MQLQTQVGESTIGYVVDWCQKFLAEYGLVELYLIRSRARGTARGNSDYDFYAVVSDAAPVEIETGRKGHERICKAFRNSLPAGFSSIDILISRTVNYEKMKDDVDTIAHRCVTEGIRLIPKEVLKPTAI